MPVGIPSMFRPVIKTKIYPAVYLRDKHVARVSEAVKGQNSKFAAAVQTCKGQGKGLKAFNRCVGDKLRK